MTTRTAADGRSERRRRAAGFSLIEVTIALGILGFGLLALTAGQLASMRFASDSRSHTVAMKLAEQRMETLMAMTPADVQALQGQPGYPNDQNNPLDPDDGIDTEYWRRAIVDLDTPEAGVMTLTVEVDWVNEIGATRTTRIQSFKAD